MRSKELFAKGNGGLYLPPHFAPMIAILPTDPQRIDEGKNL